MNPDLTAIQTLNPGGLEPCTASLKNFVLILEYVGKNNAAKFDGDLAE